jgi:2-haloacid dehalogenase
MRYRWLLLDADGTLFDYDKAEATALKRAFEQAGHQFQSEYIEVYRGINGQIWLDFEQGKISQDRLKIRRFEQLFGAVGITSDVQVFSDRYLKYLGECSYLIEGAKEVVETLHSKLGMVIITNGLAAVQRSRFARSAISRQFTDIVISEEVGASKPDTKIFDEAFRKMGNPAKEEVMIVGDSLTSDMQGGSDYGIDTCWYNPQGQDSPQDVSIQYEIRSLRGLISLVRLSPR